MEIVKDRKSSCYVLSHKRCGYHESIFVTKEELLEIQGKLFEMFEDVKD